MVSELSKSIGVSLGAMLLGLPDSLMSAVLNGTIPKLAEQIFDTDFAEISESLEPVINHATAAVGAVNNVACAVADYDDDDNDCTDRFKAVPWLDTVKGVIANLKDMPNPAADPNGSKGNHNSDYNTIDPLGMMLNSLLKHFKMIEADFSLGAGLHSKCVDFVDRFFEIPWDHAFQGSCNEVEAYDWSGYSTRYTLTKKPVCDCGVGSTPYDPSDKKESCDPEKCLCYLTNLKDTPFDSSARDQYRAVCDALAGIQKG